VSSDLSSFSMMELFRMEAESHTATLSAGLVTLEGASASLEVIEPLMRAAHSLKGAARIVGLEPAVKVAHAMEDCFVAVQKGNLALQPAHVDVLLKGVDLLVQIAQLDEKDVDAWQTAHAAVVDRLVVELISIKEPLQVAASTLSSTPVPAGNAAKTPNAETETASPNRDRDRDRVVRVTANSLTRLLGLAGEALVQTHRLPPVVDSLWQLKGRHTRLLATLQLLEDRISSHGDMFAAVERELLTKSKAQTAQGLQNLSTAVEAIADFARVSEDLSSRLHHEVLASRMRPLTDGIRGFPRLVRDLARELGKEARFEAIGESTGVDRDILDRLEAPLNHLIRNAVDHGLETPAERRSAAKVPVGRIRLEAHHRAGMLQISLSDDGRGIDLERLRTKVVERELTTAAVASRLSDAELLDFLFLPGFTTKEQVTAISGRGVGLDVVQSIVHAVRGSVRINTTLGKGTRFILHLPITVSVVRALLVEIADEPYAFPLSRIDRISMLEQNDVHHLEGKPHAMIGDQPIGLVEATTVLDLPSTLVRQAYDRLRVVVASDRGHRFGVIVDRFLGARDLRVAPLDPRLGKVPNINSSSVLENGWPVLIIDVEDLIRSIDSLLSGHRLGKLATPVAEDAVQARKRVLVVDDSITVRELERQLLESRGYSVDVAVDGVDGWNAVRSAHYDLVISDVDMPRMDGIQLVEHIKKDPRLREIPVVIVSYKDREEDRIRGLDAGANFYLTKSSFHDQTFLTTVADLISEPRG
jgi:two-component system sensor histidine kinase and response regulator WspE